MKKYYIIINGIEEGPFTLEGLRMKNLKPEDYVWRAGLDDWVQAKTLHELQFIFKKSKNLKQNKKSSSLALISKTLIVYLIFSFALGIFSSQLELYQYESYKSQLTTPKGYGGVRPLSDSHVRSSSGKWVSRWKTYMHSTSADNNENINYRNNHTVLFRPYKAIFSNAYLSSKERKDGFEISKNFILASLLSNIFLLPFIFLFYNNKT
ncbi:DUF4339 domain-containing protein [Weeksellaceae bacterium KMM 9724]|uniref:DUF4339 domain-containing protein n=1 Tax=Profundicola chukchiensis TaxID=2961959 RepID=UPI00243C7071|nr:DUF4339 domain-containing protein [Profundicola chukchiensis]MDG4950480.1 DUF4339 domain-containing protein [Profundicola chukchiensis]